MQTPTFVLQSQQYSADQLRAAIDAALKVSAK